MIVPTWLGGKDLAQLSNVILLPGMLACVSAIAWDQDLVPSLSDVVTLAVPGVDQGMHVLDPLHNTVSNSVKPKNPCCCHNLGHAYHSKRLLRDHSRCCGA